MVSSRGYSEGMTLMIQLLCVLAVLLTGVKLLTAIIKVATGVTKELDNTQVSYCVNTLAFEHCGNLQNYLPPQPPRPPSPAQHTRGTAISLPLLFSYKASTPVSQCFP